MCIVRLGVPSARLANGCLLQSARVVIVPLPGGDSFWDRRSLTWVTFEATLLSGGSPQEVGHESEGNAGDGAGLFRPAEAHGVLASGASATVCSTQRHPWWSLFPKNAKTSPLLLQRVPESKDGKNRMHVDIVTENVEVEVNRLESFGAWRCTTTFGGTGRLAG